MTDSRETLNFNGMKWLGDLKLKEVAGNSEKLRAAEVWRCQCGATIYRDIKRSDPGTLAHARFEVLRNHHKHVRMNGYCSRLDIGMNCPECFYTGNFQLDSRIPCKTPRAPEEDLDLNQMIQFNYEISNLGFLEGEEVPPEDFEEEDEV